MSIKIGLVDDHEVFLRSLGMMLNSFQQYEVVVEAGNGKELQEKMLYQQVLPDIMLIDVNMPVMDGVQTATWLSKNYPAIKLVALSMKDDDKTIIEMLRAGCCAYLLKDTNPDELEIALNEVNKHGYYNGYLDNLNYQSLSTADKDDVIIISEKEKQFLEYICTDMTYKQIAIAINVPEYTIDGYREAMFKKLNVHSRVGLAMEAIHKHLVTV